MNDQPHRPAWSSALAALLAAVRAHRPGSGEQVSWGAEVGAAIADLERMNQATERDFLAIGGKLVEFLSAAKQISSEMKELTELISGRRGDRVAEALGRVLELSREMDARAQAGDNALGALRNSAGQILRTFSWFQNAVTTFRIAGTMTRIETARLGSAGADFGHLADEVKSLAENIETRVAGVLEAVSGLAQRIGHALRNVAEMEAQQFRDLPAVVNAVMTSLASFNERQQRARDVSADLGARYRAVAAAIEDLVTSIQFHDITRQQVEHVIDALRGLCAESEGKAEPSRAACAVLKMQSSQLAAAERTFASSVQRIERDLEGIAGQVSEMSSRSRNLLGLSENAEDSFFLEMERCFTFILRTVKTCAGADASTRAAAGDLEETIRQLRSSVDEIRAVDTHMRRMALNAGIRAAHIGERGEALSVLASSMEDLSSESGRRAEEVAETLESMSAAVAGLSIAEDKEGGGGRNQESVMEEVRATIEALHSSTEISFSRIRQTAVFGASFSEDVRKARDDFSSGRVFAEAAGRALEVLRRLSGSRGDAQVDADALDNLAGRYTMQREREVHESVAMAASGESPVTVASGAPESGGGELGDNVELF